MKKIVYIIGVTDYASVVDVLATHHIEESEYDIVLLNSIDELPRLSDNSEEDPVKGAPVFEVKPTTASLSEFQSYRLECLNDFSALPMYTETIDNNYSARSIEPIRCRIFDQRSRIAFNQAKHCKPNNNSRRNARMNLKSTTLKR